MVEATGAPIVEYFAALDDPRIDRTKRHKLLDIVTIAICGTICGADNWVDIELFGNCKEEWFKSFLELPNGIPSHDTFGDVFARLDPEQFQHCFIEWVQAVAQLTQGEVVAIDGKTVRRSHDRTLGKGAIHMVNVWASSNGLALGQTKVEEKSNEITAIPKLLHMLDLTGHHAARRRSPIVTIDAMGCQKEIAREIVEVQADYLLAVKKNQGQLYEDVRDLFEGAQEFDFEGVPYDFARTVSKNHGRLETRQCWVITDPDCLDYIQTRQQWAKLNAVVKVTAQREMATGTSVQSRYYISSLASQAKTLLEPTAGAAIVRRVKPTPGSQLALFATYSYHGFITDRDGEMQNAIRDLKYGVGLNHMPSGRFASHWRPPAGVSKTACTGPWTLPFEKITVVSARIMVPKTWRSYARLPSIC